MKALFITLLTGFFWSACGQTSFTNSTQRLIPSNFPSPAFRTWQSIMEATLWRIQSDDAEGVGHAVYDIASTWAAAGFIEQANQLLTLFWTYKTEDPNHFVHTNDGFSVMWALSGKRPADIPFRMKPIDEIVQDNWDDLFGLFQGISPVYPDSIKSKSWEELTGLALSEKATMLSCDVRNPNHRADRQAQNEAILAFSRYFAIDTPVAYDLYRTAAIASIVSAGIGKDTNAKEFIMRCGQGYIQYPNNYTLESLMRDTATARYLLHGILAPVWGITDSSCTADLQRVRALLAQRIKNGPSLVFGQLTLTGLLHRLSDSAINQKYKDIDYGNAVVKARWLGYPPANPNLIRETEQRLGIRLPEDYKAFLLTSNGFRATGSTDVTFLPVERIGWLRDLDSDMVNILGSPMDKDDSARAAAFRRSILIAGLNEEQQFLLIPPGGADKEWKYWFFASWLPGERAYPSLRFYLEYELQFMMDR
jgi:hypothetical protein